MFHRQKQHSSSGSMSLIVLPGAVIEERERLQAVQAALCENSRPLSNGNRRAAKQAPAVGSCLPAECGMAVGVAALHGSEAQHACSIA